MPREQFHGRFADELYNLLELNWFGTIIKENRNMYRIGALCPDMFYFTQKEAASDLHLSSLHLHHDTHPLNRLLMLSKDFSDSQLDQARAFSAGVISHYVLDTSIHPVVLTLCGNDFSKKISIETQLDMFFGGTDSWNQIVVNDLLDDLKKDEKILLEFLLRLFDLPDTEKAFAKKILHSYADELDLFHKSAKKKAHSYVGREEQYDSDFFMYPRDFDATQGLFYNKIAYRIGGQDFKISLDQLYQDTLQRAALFMRKFEEAIATGVEAKFISKVNQRCMSTGLNKPVLEGISGDEAQLQKLLKS
jgi:hypothetical protein